MVREACLLSGRCQSGALVTVTPRLKHNAREALDAFVYLSRIEGIIPAFESAHAIAELRKRASGLPDDAIVVVNLSGRGDKDVAEARRLLGDRK